MDIFDLNNDFAKILNHVEDERYLSFLVKTFLRKHFFLNNRLKNKLQWYLQVLWTIKKSAMIY